MACKQILTNAHCGLRCSVYYSINTLIVVCCSIWILQLSFQSIKLICTEINAHERHARTRTCTHIYHPYALWQLNKTIYNCDELWRTAFESEIVCRSNLSFARSLSPVWLRSFVRSFENVKCQTRATFNQSNVANNNTITKYSHITRRISCESK